MIQPDFNAVDKMTDEVIGAINSPDANVNACTALGVLRVALRTMVHFVGREAAGEVLLKESLDVGITTRTTLSKSGTAAKECYAIYDIKSGQTEWRRSDRDEDFAEELLATGFWAICVGAGALIGFVLARALP
jgi:hypothetical protein